MRALSTNATTATTTTATITATATIITSTAVALVAVADAVDDRCVSRSDPTHPELPVSLSPACQHLLSSASHRAVSLETVECRTVTGSTAWHMDGVHLRRRRPHQESLRP